MGGNASKCCVGEQGLGIPGTCAPQSIHAFLFLDLCIFPTLNSHNVYAIFACHTRQLEDGLHLVVRNETATATETAAERSPHELSGGQQALLGLSLVLALSSYQAPPLCLLDEIDAALDESNQVRCMDMPRKYMCL